MKIENLKEVLDKLGADVHYDETLKLYNIFLGDFVVYLRPDDLERFDYDELQKFLVTNLVLKQFYKPYVTLN